MKGVPAGGVGKGSRVGTGPSAWGRPVGSGQAKSPMVEAAATEPVASPSSCSMAVGTWAEAASASKAWSALPPGKTGGSFKSVATGPGLPLAASGLGICRSCSKRVSDSSDGRAPVRAGCGGGLLTMTVMAAGKRSGAIIWVTVGFESAWRSVTKAPWGMADPLPARPSGCGAAGWEALPLPSKASGCLVSAAWT
jgi:hypothetical protein